MGILFGRRLVYYKPQLDMRNLQRSLEQEIREPVVFLLLDSNISSMLMINSCLWKKPHSFPVLKLKNVYFCIGCHSYKDLFFCSRIFIIWVLTFFLIFFFFNFNNQTLSFLCLLENPWPITVLSAAVMQILHLDISILLIPQGSAEIPLSPEKHTDSPSNYGLFLLSFYCSLLSLLSIQWNIIVHRSILCLFFVIWDSL